MPHQENTPAVSDAFPLPVFSECEARIDALPSLAIPRSSALLSELPDRRLFLKMLAFPCAAACAMALSRDSIAIPVRAWAPAEEDDSRFRVEARFYEKLPGKMVRCKLCPRECVVEDRSRGYCRVRENRSGTYYTLVHSRVVAAHIDPI